MKFLKGLFIVIISIIIIYVILGLLGPKDYSVTRSKEINAPASVVYEQISNFKNWEKWSPWIEKDPSVVNTYTGELGQVGSVMSWVGDEELSGTGNMKITSATINKEVQYHLSFIVPFEMQSKGGMTLVEKDGKTTVTWFDKGDIGFMMRPMMLFMDLDAQIGPDFEKGLNNIDSVSQELSMTKKEIVITETLFPANNYVAIRHNTTFEEVMSTKFYEDNFKKLGQYVGEAKAVLSGAPSSICYSWNEEDSTTEIALAFPLQEVTSVNKPGFELIALKEQTAILAKYYGPYEGVGEAHVKIEAYVKEKGLKTGLVIEEYANDPTSVASPDEILTNVYYLIEE